MVFYYLTVSLVCIFSMLLLSYIIHKSDAVSKHAQFYFRHSIFATVIIFLAEITTVCLETAPAHFFWLSAIANAVGFSAFPFIPMLIGCAISAPTQRDASLWLFPGVNAVLSLLSPAFPLVFSVSQSNEYARGPLWWFFIVSYGVSMGVLLLKTVAAGKQCQNCNHHILYILFLFVLLGTSVQALFPQLYLSWFCISFAIGLYYIYYCELHHQVDALTGLLSRRAYERCLERIRSRKSAMIIIFDIDDFKSINDRYGHLSGDACITAVSSCIKDTFSDLGLCFRTGGDEFCVISESAGEAAIQDAYRRFLREIVVMRSAKKWLPLVSIGFARYDPRVRSLEDALFLADQRMYRFKQARKSAAARTTSPGMENATVDLFSLA